MPKGKYGQYHMSERQLHADRLRHARKAIEATPDYPDQGDQSALGDLLGNLRHWAEKKGLDWDAADNMGLCHWEDERTLLPRCPNCTQQGCDPCGAVSSYDCLCSRLPGDDDA